MCTHDCARDLSIQAREIQRDASAPNWQGRIRVRIKHEVAVMECQIAEHLGRGFGYDIATYSAQRLDAFQLIAKERQEDIALQDDSYGHPLLSSHAKVHSCSVKHIVAMTCIGWCLCAFLSPVMAVSLHDFVELRCGPNGQNKM